MPHPSKLKRPFSSLLIAGAVTIFGAASGCGGEGFSLPLEFESQPYSVDVDEHVVDFEVNACADEDSENCRVIKALDRSDDGEVSNPPTIPTEFPTEVDVEECDENGNCASTTVDISQWLDEDGLGLDVSNQLSTAIGVDLREELGDELDQIGDPSQIDTVSITRLAVDYKENTLTFDVPAVDLYIGPGGLDTDDAAALISAGSVTKVGTLERRGQGTGPANVEFVSGGSDRFSDAIKSLEFTAVMAVPDSETINLREGAAQGTLQKPGGEAEVTLQVEVTFTVNAPSGSVTLPF